MRALLVSLLCLVAHCSFAQNYQCLQYGMDRFFLNEFVRGVHIDSMSVSGNETTFTLFRSPRGSYSFSGNPQQLDSTKGSWFGDKVVIRSDGTTLFNTYWGDTLFLQTRAGLGSSWTMYNDTSDRYYTATVTSIDTMTIFGSVDSVKSITINAYSAQGPNTADLANNKTIRISKGHGIVETFSLYMFPFHPANISSYQQGYDYLMDKRDLVSGSLKTYQLIQHAFPSSSDLYNWDVGDVFEYLKDELYNSVDTKTWHVDSVYDKIQTSPSTIEYHISVESKTYHPPFNQNPGTWTFSNTTEQFTVDNLHNIFMPEEKWNPMVLTIKGDTSLCLSKQLYSYSSSLYAPFGEFCFEESRYKEGLGRTRHDECLDPAGHFISETLIYYRKNGIDCGSIIPITGIADIMPDRFRVYPNPASSVLRIDNAGSLSYSIIDLTGRVIDNGGLAKGGKIDVSQLSEGTYFIKLTDASKKAPAVLKFLIVR